MPDRDFSSVYQALRQVMLDNAGDQIVGGDKAGWLVLLMKEHDAQGEPGWFGTVAIKNSYVAYWLIPLRDQPSLADGLSPMLAKHCQDGFCFRFSKVDETLFAELAALTARCAGSAR